MIATGVHQVKDIDEDPTRQADEVSSRWVGTFGATPFGTKVEGVRRCFEGKALVRVRATVAHDSYERLVEVPGSVFPWTKMTPSHGSAPLGAVARTFPSPIPKARA
jgi:hypothetical protein